MTGALATPRSACGPVTPPHDSCTSGRDSSYHMLMSGTPSLTLHGNRGNLNLLASLQTPEPANLKLASPFSPFSSFGDNPRLFRHLIKASSFRYSIPYTWTPRSYGISKPLRDCPNHDRDPPHLAEGQSITLFDDTHRSALGSSVSAANARVCSTAHS